MIRIKKAFLRILVNYTLKKIPSIFTEYHIYHSFRVHSLRNIIVFDIITQWLITRFKKFWKSAFSNF